MGKKEKYYILLKQYKNHSVLNQNYEFAAYLRDIEKRYFIEKIPDMYSDEKMYKVITSEDFDPKSFLKELENSIYEHDNHSIHILRNFKLNEILD